jgi:phosphoglycerate dehydrogenase-like enzyme
VPGFDEMMSTDDLVAAAKRADYLINILPASKNNLDIFSKAVFDAMKPTAYFINAGRGETVDEAAMIDTLKNKRIAGAGLDVYRTEPLPKDNPLWDMPNVFMTPHIGGYFIEYESYALPIVLENMQLFLAGQQKEMRNIIAR